MKKNGCYIVFSLLLFITSCRNDDAPMPSNSTLLAGNWYVAEGTQAVDKYEAVTEITDIYQLMRACEKDNPWEFSPTGYFGFHFKGLPCEGDGQSDTFFYQRTWSLSEDNQYIRLEWLGEDSIEEYEIMELTEESLVLYTEFVEEGIVTELTLVFERNP